MSSIKILVAYHKPAPVIRNEIMTPIHAGRALYGSAAGADNGLRDMIGDDTGDNISLRNPYFSELTAAYWAWKNYDSLGSPEYIGLAHYRRMLGFMFREEEGVLTFPDLASVPVDNYSQTVIESVVRKYDLCARGPIRLMGTDTKTGQKFPVSVVDQYAHAHNAKHLRQAVTLAARKYPEYREAIREYLAGDKHYLCNLFVMRRPVFFAYASWLFDILLEMDGLLDYSGRSDYEKRAVSFLAERLTGIFITRHLRGRSLNIRHLIGVDIM